MDEMDEMDDEEQIYQRGEEEEEGDEMMWNNNNYILNIGVLGPKTPKPRKLGNISNIHKSMKDVSNF